MPSQVVILKFDKKTVLEPNSKQTSIASSSFAYFFQMIEAGFLSKIGKKEAVTRFVKNLEIRPLNQFPESFPQAR